MGIGMEDDLAGFWHAGQRLVKQKRWRKRSTVGVLICEGSVF
jgi:hypothetical protein